MQPDRAGRGGGQAAAVTRVVLPAVEATTRVALAADGRRHPLPHPPGALAAAAIVAG